MRKHIIRKSLGLIVLYAAIIIGIFVIQFRSDSIIRKTIHSMRVTLTADENSTESISLKNHFQINCNGIQFSADDSNPVEYCEKSRNKKASLINWEETETSVTLIFSHDIKITFTMPDSSDKTPLMVSADFPENFTNISIPTKTLSGFNFTDIKSNQAIIEGKNSTYSLIAPKFEDSRLIFLQHSKFARYSPFVKQAEFSIDSIADLPGTTKTEWEGTLSTFNSTIINEFSKQSQSDPSFVTNLTEQTVISYVAAMSELGRYNEALNTVPDSFVKGTKRTYQSAPFFGTLSKVAPGLQVQMENYKNMITHAIQSSSCDIFTMENIDNYMIIFADDPAIKNLLSLPASLTENNFTVLQAAGILKVYSSLNEEGLEIASLLEPVLEPCVKTISDACKLEENKIRIEEKDTNLSVLSSVLVGDSLIRYGRTSSNVNIEKCGYLIITSYLSTLSGLDLRTLCEIYPFVTHDNPYYPHFAKVRDLDGKPIWAWTIARDITITQDENRTLFIDINFPLGLTHYVILTGINPFRRIQIYNMDFRTDPQFEIYNSSGYVYRLSMKSLLLKSRHKSQHEIVKLFYRDVQNPEPIEEIE